MTLQEMRVRKGLSLREAADKLGVDFGTVSRWETGKKKPQFKNMRALAALYETSISLVYDALVCRQMPA